MGAASFMFLLSLSPFILILCLVLYGLRVISRMNKRADERLELDRKSFSMQQKQISLLTSVDERLAKVEQTLNEVN
ncbi:hypothetical protein [Robertmurraya andreesenii]|uniref:Phage shock protein B n=1 Tax=Anoxybacillus andreesenii TaxID=1325932 RepID=A0ABT9V4H7_9BACL|nr:hypothetical protein [Robertmurraya andreesenii]MDQ0155760.1 hypothetical protein [Robertmurraya andreesenii]